MSELYSCAKDTARTILAKRRIQSLIVRRVTTFLQVATCMFIPVSVPLRSGAQPPDMQGKTSRSLRIHLYRAEAVVRRAKPDDHSERITEALRSIVTTSLGLNQPRKAEGALKRLLESEHHSSDQDAEAEDAYLLAGVELQLGKNMDAISAYEQVIAATRALGDEENEARALNELGTLLASNQGGGDKLKAVEMLTNAIPLFESQSDRISAARVRRFIGSVEQSMGNLQPALQTLDAAESESRQIGDTNGQAEATEIKALVYADLGRDQEALKILEKVRQQYDDESEQITSDTTQASEGGSARSHRLPDHKATARQATRAAPDAIDSEQLRILTQECGVLNDLGLIELKRGDYATARRSFMTALPLAKAARDSGAEGRTFANLGELEFASNNMPGTRMYLDYAFHAWALGSDRNGETMAQITLGRSYASQREHTLAMQAYKVAALMVARTGDLLVGALLFHAMMQEERASRPAVAIFFGKRSVSLIQKVRGGLLGLDQPLRESFVVSNTTAYRDLADLLIERGRLAEAQAVLDLLKEQEYAEYVRGVAPKEVPLTLKEQLADREYTKSSAHLVELGRRWSELAATQDQDAESAALFNQTNLALLAANKELDNYFDRLFLRFGRGANANLRVDVVMRDTVGLKAILHDLPGAIAIYTVLTNTRLREIVVTDHIRVAREYPIPEAELLHKIAAFRQALLDPTLDARKSGQQLYAILVGPIQGDLDEAHANTVVWSLDGALRYVPLGALYDGSHYLIERYATVVLPPQVKGDLVSVPHGVLHVLGMGLSDSYEGNEPLRAVASELREVVNDKAVKGSVGVLPGVILLNGDFTEEAMVKGLRGKHEVVHIASHYIFQPSSDKQQESYLLLAGNGSNGTGFHLTLSNFKNNELLDLTGTDLLTLSACDTGLPGQTSDGREVDGLAGVAQEKGARSVLSSLWAVDDQSTGILMATFYHRWADGLGSVSKVEALRASQLDFIMGRVPGLNATDSEEMKRPYYWAPFELSGNWR